MEVEERLALNPNQPRAEALNRFTGMTTSGRFHRVKDQYQLLTEDFGLPWEGKMEIGIEAWKRQRNQLGHGSADGELELDDLFDKARLAGAINVLCACAIGHEGPIALSLIEDLFVRMKPRSS